LEAREAVSEYFLRLLLALPSKPAVVMLETGSGDGMFNTAPAHLQAAERYGVPFVSFRKALSYPDNPNWQFFFSKKGYFLDTDKPQVETLQGHEVLNGQYLFPPVKEGPEPTEGDSHHFLRCWGGHISHPYHTVHRLVAETLFYFTTVSAKAASTMKPFCEKNQETFKHALPSSSAIRLRPFLDPYKACPEGALVHYSSKIIAGQNDKAVSLLGPDNEASAWRLIEDRPGKWGWILNTATGDPTRDTLNFNLTLGAAPLISIEYMHSYEGVGKVLLTLKQQGGSLLGAQLAKPLGTASSTVSPGAQGIGPLESPVIVDAFQPAVRYALYTEFEMSPIGFVPGPATLQIKLLELTDAEREERRNGKEDFVREGGKFKLISVRSC